MSTVIDSVVDKVIDWSSALMTASGSFRSEGLLQDRGDCRCIMACRMICSVIAGKKRKEVNEDRGTFDAAVWCVQVLE
jgi:hypothetical protein